MLIYVWKCMKFQITKQEKNIENIFYDACASSTVLHTWLGNTV